MTSIRVRLLVSLLALLALAAAAMGAVTYRNVLGETEAIFDYQLQQMALSLRDQGEIAAAQADNFADAQLDFVVQIWTVDGRSIYASRPHSSLPARALLGLATLKVEGHAWRTYSVATRERVIQIAQPVEIRERLAARAAWRSVLPLLLMAPVPAFVIWWLAARNLAPLDRLAGEVRSRDAQSLAPLAVAGLPDEVSPPLARALNALLERLRLSLDTQRAFVADAAHELRSPLTALKLQLELLRRAADDADRDAARDAIAAGIDRATRLVEQLLALARSEPGAAPAIMERVDLAEIARRAVADTVAFRGVARRRVRARRRGARLRRRRCGLARAAGSQPRRQRGRYSAEGSRVEVSVAAGKARSTLTIDDAGPGIPESERQRVFDRFYRRAEAGESGSGLGLAIVKSVAMAHGASVALDRSPQGGLRVSVSFAAGGQAASPLTPA